jgi:hypothetical protein
VNTIVAAVEIELPNVVPQLHFSHRCCSFPHRQDVLIWPLRRANEISRRV